MLVKEKPKMKIEVLQESLLSGLNIVGRAVATRAQLPALSHILIEATSSGLTLSATDLEIGIQTKVAAKVEEPGKVAVPAKMFGEFLASLNPGKIVLSLEKESLQVIAPGYKGKFQTIAVEEFPALSIPEPENEMGEIAASELKAAIEHVVFASAKDSLRPVLTGVLWEMGKKKLKLVATDGFRLAIEEINIDGKREEAKLLVPSRVVAEVVRLSGEGQIKVGHIPATSQIYFVIGDVLVISQLLEGNFPDYNKIMPKEFLTEIKASREELLQAVKATYIFARDNSNMVGWKIEGKLLILSSNSPERGECRVEVPIELTGEESEIVFNAKFVLDYLGMIVGEQVWIGFSGKLAPGMFKDLSRTGGQYVVMPINA
jgi:DNA polymerase-3 subunit beta